MWKQNSIFWADSIKKFNLVYIWPTNLTQRKIRFHVYALDDTYFDINFENLIVSFFFIWINIGYWTT